MDWLRRFMYGRYGGDQLSTSLLVLSITLTLIGRMTDFSWLYALGYFPMLVAIFRIFSKNIFARRSENQGFLSLVSPLYVMLNQVTRQIKERKTHKFFKCSKCKTVLRVPRGKGKIMITCPRCKEKFMKST